MEEPIYIILFTIVVIALSVFSAIKKEKNSAKEMEQEGEPPIVITPKKTTNKRRNRGHYGHAALHPDSQEHIINDIDARRNQYSLHSEGDINTLEESQNRAKHEIIEDFDPKKAIIWSEIMKPKFDDK